MNIGKQYDRSENLDYINKGLEDWQDDIENENINSAKQREIDEEKRITRKIAPIDKIPIDKKSALEFLNHEKTRLENIKYEGFLEDNEMREKYQERMKEIVNATNKYNINEVVFLDKGARLFGYFFSKLWDVIKTDKPKPGMSFINIGYEKQRSNPLVNEDYDTLYDEKKFNELTKDIKKQILKTFGNKFDKKNILIFDEHCHRGNTLLYTSKLFEKIYPNSEIFSDWFDWGAGRSYKYASKRLNMLTSKNDLDNNYNLDFIDTEEIRKNPSGILEPSIEESIQAKAWTKETREKIQEENYIKEMINIRKQLYKLALEMLPEKENKIH